MTIKSLITGQDGSYLAEFLLEKGYEGRFTPARRSFDKAPFPMRS
jgi:GDP-D-mannose dehydratase